MFRHSVVYSDASFRSRSKICIWNVSHLKKRKHVIVNQQIWAIRVGWDLRLLRKFETGIHDLRVNPWFCSWQMVRHGSSVIAIEIVQIYLQHVDFAEINVV